MTFSKSMVILSTKIPKSFEFFISLTNLLAFINAFEGTHPVFKQSPPLNYIFLKFKLEFSIYLSSIINVKKKY